MRIALLLTALLAFPERPLSARALDPAASLVAYKAERAAADALAAPETLAACDGLALQAEAALKAGQQALAARLVREARWALPAPPPPARDGVARVLGAAPLRHADRVNAFALSADGATALSASRDGTVRAWNLGNGREGLSYAGHQVGDRAGPARPEVFRVGGVAVSPDGATAASSGAGEIHIWGVADGKRRRTIPTGPEPTRGLAFAPKQDALVVAGDDKRVAVYDAKTGALRYRYPEQGARVEALALHPGGKLLATVNAKGELAVYPLADELRPALFVVPLTRGEQALYSVAFVPDSTNVVVAGADGQVRLVAGPSNNGAGERATAGSGLVLKSVTASTGRVTCLAPTADGKRVFAGGSDNAVRLWDLTSGKVLDRLQLAGGASPVVVPGQIESAETGVTAIALTPDEEVLLIGTVGGAIRTWELQTAQTPTVAEPAGGELWALSSHPKLDRTLTAGADGVVRLYSGPAAKPERTFAHGPGPVTGVAWLDESHFVSAGSDGVVKLWDDAGGEAKPLIKLGGAAVCLAVGPKPGGVAVGTGGKELVGVGREGKERFRLPTRSTPTALVAVGGQLAAGFADGTVQLVELGDAAKLGAIASAHTGGVLALAAHPRESLVASGGGDGAVRLWRAAGGTLAPAGRIAPASGVAPPAGPPAAASLAFTPDGNTLLVGAADGVVRAYDALTLAPKPSLRGHAGWVTALATVAGAWPVAWLWPR